MKKITVTLLCCILLLTCFLLVGCGHKSSAELTDIEQFRCQDSIQTVFDVLGETELENGTFGGEYYTYKDLNLWGYNGEAVFSVRDDKETIKEFYCHLTLTDKEFKELLSQFSNKYGSYQVSEYSNFNSIVYKWNIESNKAEELGYNDIHIQYDNDKKYTIYFEDELSIINDEKYYEYLKENEMEKEESDNESQLNIISKKEYEIDDGELTIVLLGDEENGEIHISFSGTANTEEKASIMLATILSKINNKGGIFDKYSLFISCDSGAISYNDDKREGHVVIFGENRDGSLSLSTPDWIITEFTMPEEELDKYTNEIINALLDFVDEFNPDKKTKEN